MSVLLRLIVLSAGFLDYWSYSQTFYREPGVWMDMVSGTAHAPGQYRIGVIDTAYFLARHTHLGLRHTLALLDVIAGLIAVFTLFLVLRRSPVYRRASQAAEWFGAASFVVLVQFYLAWLLWYQKPETLPTAAMLSLALLLLTVRLNGRLGTMVPVVGLLLLAVAQGFVRADAPFALHVGILLVCLTPAGRGFALPRRLQAGTSLGAVVLAVGIQSWLMWRMYPQANLWRYPGAATVSQPEIAGEICSVPSFPGAVRVDRSDVDAETLSGGFGADCDVYGSGYFSGDVGDGWADRGSAHFSAVYPDARAPNGGACDATFSSGTRDDEGMT